MRQQWRWKCRLASSRLLEHRGKENSSRTEFFQRKCFLRKEKSNHMLSWCRWAHVDCLVYVSLYDVNEVIIMNRHSLIVLSCLVISTVHFKLINSNLTRQLKLTGKVFPSSQLDSINISCQASLCSWCHNSCGITWWRFNSFCILSEKFSQFSKLFASRKYFNLMGEIPAVLSMESCFSLESFKKWKIPLRVVPSHSFWAATRTWFVGKFCLVSCDTFPFLLEKWRGRPTARVKLPSSFLCSLSLSTDNLSLNFSQE